jgi:DNA helicase-2/ATP-dependent DNA helicase PcrA
VSFDIADLNPQQKAAVECIDGPLLLFAGAGTGKTRVLTYRIAHLIEDLAVPPWQILAITFTNKAAAEMRERLGLLLADSERGMRGLWALTFHSFCVRILRENAELIGYTPHFTIYDDDDSKRLVKEIYAALGIDSKRFPLNALRGQISKAKNELLLAADYAEQAGGAGGYPKLVARVYAELQARLHRADAMDFDDLLVNAYLLLKQNPTVLDGYQERFRYISVDEYQDTNHAQYQISRLLAAKYQNIMVVGDDDQSIYSWRGADLRNILEFEQDYPKATVMKLEQNYRSSANILDAANAVIAHNNERRPKHLFCDSGKGAKVKLYQAQNERDEGRYIASEIERLTATAADTMPPSARPPQKGAGGVGPHSYKLSDFAVFYRTNAQSRVLEDMFLRAGLRYKIYGGTQFFARQEIRDVMAYLKVVVNPADGISAKRIINVPRRGIGKTSVAKIEQIAAEQQLTFLEACAQALAEGILSPGTAQKLGDFLKLLREAVTWQGDLRQVVELIVDRAGLIAAYEAENSDEAKARVENIMEFFGQVGEYAETHVRTIEEAGAGAGAESGEQEAAPAGDLVPISEPSDTADQLAEFVEWLALRSDLDTLDAGEDYVTLMTVHAAKGLEFPVVFMAGMEESIFPHMASLSEGKGKVEEERRLAYVAITRAKELLYLVYARTRSLFGSTSANPVSRFVREIPVELCEREGVGANGFAGFNQAKRGDRHGMYDVGSFQGGAGPSTDGGHVFGGGGGKKQKAAPILYQVGDQVNHKTFGHGVVAQVKGDMLTIQFDKLAAPKKLLPAYAPMVKL